MDISLAWAEAPPHERCSALARANYSEKEIAKYSSWPWLRLPMRTRYRIMEADFKYRQLDFVGQPGAWQIV